MDWLPIPDHHVNEYQCSCEQSTAFVPFTAAIDLFNANTFISSGSHQKVMKSMKSQSYLHFPHDITQWQSQDSC